MMMAEQREVRELKALCKSHKLDLVERPNGHFQIKGVMLVNYYPLAKKKALYVAGTAGALTHASAARAVAIAAGQDAFVLSTQVNRKNNYRAEKRRMLVRDPRCHWCQLALTIQTATLDHKIPLSRGGLNNANNYVLACQPCNSARGNSLPKAMP